ncbi:MAG TPA: pyridoxamine 5'-phosphate oxidase family protein [Acidimicrobiales bacterium]|nr:pyridoxamine 5'-phosphate oxidase family protein [Acidimicrobiales bacterium]
MTPLRKLPEPVQRVVTTSLFAEFATLTCSGVPIDTPIYCFPSDDLATIDLATGLAYPAKAERARRDPRVGLLMEGPDGGPVVAIAGRAAVRDADLQSNAVRYLAETGLMPPNGDPWDVARHAVWYWTRIIVSVTPAKILWWDSVSEMDGPPQRWEAGPDAVYPDSDPAPSGRVSSPASWPLHPWRELASAAMVRRDPAHVTLCDGDGYPMPFRASTVEMRDDGFELTFPSGLPWAGGGKSSLTFRGLETFLGRASIDGKNVHFAVERALPQHPMMVDPREITGPGPATKDQLMRRLREETARRNQVIPTIPEEQPALTSLAKLRAAQLAGG